MGSALVGGALVGGALVGCADREVTLALALPPHAGAASIVLAVERDGASTLTAATLDATRPTFFVDRSALGGGPSVHLWALVYDASLAELSLAEGPLALAASGDDATRPLPAGERLFSTSVELEGGAALDWRAEGERGAELARLRIALPVSPCPELDVELYELDSPAQVMFAVELDDETALVALDDGTFRTIDHTGRVTRIAAPGGLPFRGVSRGGDRLWLVGPEPLLATAHLEGADLVVDTSTTIPEPGSYKWIVADGTPPDDTVLTLTRNGQLLQRTRGAWRSLHTFEPPLPDTDPHGGLTAVAPGEWVAGHEFTAGVVRIQDGVARSEELPPAGSVRAVRHVPGFGTVVGTGEGQFIVHDGTTWTVLPGSPLTTFVSSLQEYPGGFAYGGVFGSFGLYLRDYGFCPKSIPVTFHVQQLVRFGADVLLAGRTPGYPRTPFAILRPR